MVQLSPLCMRAAVDESRDGLQLERVDRTDLAIDQRISPSTHNASHAHWCTRYITVAAATFACDTTARPTSCPSTYHARRGRENGIALAQCRGGRTCRCGRLSGRAGGARRDPSASPSHPAPVVPASPEANANRARTSRPAPSCAWPCRLGPRRRADRLFIHSPSHPLVLLDARPRVLSTSIVLLRALFTSSSRLLFPFFPGLVSICTLRARRTCRHTPLDTNPPARPTVDPTLADVDRDNPSHHHTHLVDSKRPSASILSSCHSFDRPRSTRTLSPYCVNIGPSCIHNPDRHRIEH